MSLFPFGDFGRFSNFGGGELGNGGGGVSWRGWGDWLLDGVGGDCNCKREKTYVGGVSF